MFIVQDSVHADHVSRHRTRERAVAAIYEMIRAGLAKPGELNVREIDERGRVVDVFAAHELATAALASDVSLTPREREVLELYLSGYSYDEMAGRLLITQATVRQHVTRVRAKLKRHGATDAPASALREKRTA